MEKTVKKSVALLLAMVMLLSIAPLSGAAESFNYLTTAISHNYTDDYDYYETTSWYDDGYIATPMEPVTPDAPNPSTPENAETLVLDSKLNVGINSGYETYLKFIPEEDGVYIFTSHSEEDTYATLYDENMNYLYSDDDGSYNYNFEIRYNLIAGETYYFAVRFLNGDGGNFDVELSKLSEEIKNGEKLTFESDGHTYKYYAFVPEEDGTYIFKANERDYVELWAADADFNWIANGYYGNYSVSASYNMTAGETYYFCLNYYNDEACSFDVELNKFVGASGTWGGNITYTIDLNGVLTLDGKGEMKPREEYWDEYDGYHYEEYPWREYSSLIYKVIIGKDILSVEQNAFGSCYNLAEVTFEEGCRLETIGFRAFDSCNSLVSITIPASVTEIGYYTFADCNNLTSISLPDGIKYIDEGAFRYTGYYNDSANWDKGVLYIGKYLVDTDRYVVGNNQVATNSDATSVYSVREGTLGIAENAFSDADYLTGVEIPASVRFIGDYAFQNCSYLSEFSVEENSSLESVGYDPFYETPFYDNAQNWEDGVLYADCILVKAKSDAVPDTYEVREGTRVICGNAFYECFSLTSVTLPDGLKQIGNQAFHYCKNLGEITIPASVTEISDYAFYECGYLTSVTFGEGSELEEIGDGAFGYCNNLTSITLPEGVTVIGGYAFEGCYALASINIPASVEEIGDDAFYNCYNLTSVEIPASVKEIGEGAFCYSGLASITVADGNEYYSSDESSVLFNKDKSVLIQYPRGNESTSYEVPASVTEISDYAFLECYNLTSVTFGEGSELEEIGDGAFEYCNNLTTITLPEGVTVIGDYAFEGCYALASINIPASVEEIGGGAFRYTSLASITVADGNEYYSSDESGVLFNKDKSVLIQYPRGNESTSYEIPASVTEIGLAAFEECGNLVSVTFEEGGKPETISDCAFRSCYNLASIEIPASVTHIGNEVFQYCDSLASITVADGNEYYSSDENGVLFNNDKTVLILYPYGNESTFYEVPASVIEIGDGAFYNSYSLASVTFEEGSRLETIGYAAFESCNALTSIVIPASVKIIDDYAFEYCYNLASVTFEAGSKLEAIGYAAFFRCQSLTDIALPDGLRYIYGDAFRWCESLTGISIPSSVEEIGGETFYGCPEDMIIFGYAESAAERYAEEYGFAFSILDGDAFVTINGPAAIDSKDFTLFGRATPYSTVEIYDGFDLLGTAEADASGRWSGIFELVDPDNGSVHRIKAKVTVDDATVTTKAHKITYDDGAIIAEKFEIYHNGTSIVVDESNVMNAIKYLVIDPMKPFTFKVKLNRPVSYLSVVSTKDGESRMIDAAYDEQSGCWIASGWFNPYNHSYIPGTYSLEVNGGETVDIYMRVMKYILDPSGIVYEAVKSNVIQGATATIQYKDENGNAVTWGADEFDQVNPIVTGADGAFAWDVPEGDWRVTVSKNGYETATTDWMTVPPVRTGIDIGLVSTEAPKVEYVNVYEDGIEFKFTQYMDIDTVNSSNITVSCNGEAVEGEFTAVDSEVSGSDENVYYATAFEFTPAEKFNGTVGVSIGFVNNYCGNTMYDGYYQEFEIGRKVEDITLFTSGEITLNDSLTVIVLASPPEAAEGKTVTVSLSDPYVLNAVTTEATFDKNGMVAFNFGAALPGECEITFGIDGTSVSKETVITVNNLPVEDRPDTEHTTIPVTVYPTVRPTLSPSTTSPDVEDPSDSFETTRPKETTTKKPVTTTAPAIPTTTRPVVETTTAPVTTEPSTTQPIVETTTAPVVTEPSTTQPVVETTTVPATTEIVTVKPTESTTAKPVPTTVKPTVRPTEPVTKPVPTTVRPTEPATTKPVPTTSKPTEPATTKPVPTTVKPTEPATTKPAEPTTTKPVVTVPVPSVVIRTPSITSIEYGDSIYLHADTENLPDGAYIEWTSDNGNMKIVSYSADGSRCLVTPSASGVTIFTATVYDADGNVIDSDTQSMTSQAGFLRKLVGWLKNLFGLTIVFPEIFKDIF